MAITQDALKILRAPVGYDLPSYLKMDDNVYNSASLAATAGPNYTFAPHRPALLNGASRATKLPSLMHSSNSSGNYMFSNDYGTGNSKFSKNNMRAPFPPAMLPGSFDEVATGKLVNALCPPLNRSA
uniref:Sex-determining region Y protein n=1 Tax=Lygus hesperus TaxID=30085 RepID=A0A0A9YWW5_LYGHE